MGKPDSIEVDAVIGADGANSRVAKEIGAGDYDYAIAFQARSLALHCAVRCGDSERGVLHASAVAGL